MLPTKPDPDNGSVADSASLIQWKNTFDIEEPNTKTKFWYKWFNTRIRQYRFLEILFFISLLVILYRLQTISNQNDRVLEKVSSENLITLIIADYLRGATVEQHCSSRSSLIDDYRFDQTNLVLLDRPQPPADKAWCTTDKNPALTINLAKYIKPISVSYQHSKWNGTVPIGAPKTYDVLACLDCARDGWHPLAMNCQYSQHESNGKEQMCNISSHLNVPLIRKVQFRFRKNYGDTNMTCVHLVRVYGETKTPIKIEEKNLKPKEICTDLRWYYHNNYLRYIWTQKSCAVLYINKCCNECPECCQECLIVDVNKYFISPIIFFALLLSFLLLLLFKIWRCPEDIP